MVHIDEQIKLKSGVIHKQDLPLITKEPKLYSGGRVIAWSSVVVIVLLLFTIFVVQRKKEYKTIQSSTSKILIDEYSIGPKLNTKYTNEFDVPYAKYIDIYIARASLPKITYSQLTHLFEFYATTTTHKFIKLDNRWLIIGDMYLMRLTLPNYTQLTSLTIHTKPTLIIAKKWDVAFKSIQLMVRDKMDRIIWADTIILDFATGESTVGYIANGDIPIQFDLNKYA